MALRQPIDCCAAVVRSWQGHVCCRRKGIPRGDSCPSAALAFASQRSMWHVKHAWRWTTFFCSATQHMGRVAARGDRCTEQVRRMVAARESVRPSVRSSVCLTPTSDGLICRNRLVATTPNYNYNYNNSSSTSSSSRGRRSNDTSSKDCLKRRVDDSYRAILSR